MVNCELLKDQGWNLSSKGLSLISSTGSVTNLNSVINNALNTDLKDIGCATLPNELKKEETGKIVLQIQKIRNVSAPKANPESQAAPRMLRLILTDGHSTCQAIEISNISKISYKNTSPGTKVLITGAKIVSNCLILTGSNCSVLGGIVPHLHDKWELTKNINAERRSSNVDGPPPWVNFGEKIISGDSNGEFKSLATKASKEASKEFEEQRQGAIAELKTGAVKKVFGGGVKNNNLIKSNQNRESNKWENRNKEHDKERVPRGRKDKGNREKDDKVQIKPPEKVSLFDFLEKKLPQSENTISKITYSEPTINEFKTDDAFPQNKNYAYKNTVIQKAPRFQKQGNFVGYHDFNNQPKHYIKPPLRNDIEYPYKVEQQWYRNDKVYKQEPLIQPTNNDKFLVQEKKIQENAYFNNSFSTPRLNYNPMENDKRNFGLNTENKLTEKMDRMSLNSQYATRSLKQHLNIVNQESMRNNTENKQKALMWKVGDHCMAKYWEDRKYYNATVINLSENTCVVRFNDYGNVEEVLKTDCIPIANVQYERNHYNNYSNSNPQKPERYNNKTFYRRT